MGKHILLGKQVTVTERYSGVATLSGYITGHTDAGVFFDVITQTGVTAGFYSYSLGLSIGTKSPMKKEDRYSKGSAVTSFKAMTDLAKKNDELVTLSYNFPNEVQVTLGKVVYIDEHEVIITYDKYGNNTHSIQRSNIIALVSRTREDKDKDNDEDE